MRILEEKLRAPQLRVTGWVNSPPLSQDDLRGKVVLIDFWDYTCINCLHTLPYLKEWQARYADAGLVIIGIHAPEFSFAVAENLVAGAVSEWDIHYPVATDNDFQTWNAFANRGWPAKYLIDAQGMIRATQQGEGSYAEFERLIQTCLREISPSANFPEPMAVVREIDVPGAVCARVTPELYCGWARGELGNPEGMPRNRTVIYGPTETVKPDTLYLQGAWRVGREAVESFMGQAARLLLDYEAAQLNWVAASASESLTVEIRLDGSPVPVDACGPDVVWEEGKTVVHVDTPRMYALLRHAGVERHQLELVVSQPGLRAYALTFVSCVQSG